MPSPPGNTPPSEADLLAEARRLLGTIIWRHCRQAEADYLRQASYYLSRLFVIRYLSTSKHSLDSLFVIVLLLCPPRTAAPLSFSDFLFFITILHRAVNQIII